MDKTFYILYRVTNNLNGKIYVGVHKTKNLDDGYMGSGKVINAAIAKYGIENFTRVILEQFENSTAMYTREKEVVTDEFLAREDTYNLRRGGHGGFDYINSKPMSQESKDNKSKSLKGRIFTDEHKAKLSKANARRGKPSTFRNRTHSAESRKKIADRHYPTGGNHAEAKAIFVNDIFYPSIRDAADTLNVSHSRLTDFLKGRATSSKKYPWINSVRYAQSDDPR